MLENGVYSKDCDLIRDERKRIDGREGRGLSIVNVARACDGGKGACNDGGEGSLRLKLERAQC